MRRDCLLPARFFVLFGAPALAAWLGSGCGDDTVQPLPTPPRSNFSPTADTTLVGRWVFDRVTVPAGVTVTASDDLILRARGRVLVNGSIVGPPSAALTLHGDSTVTVSGAIRNPGTGRLAPRSAAGILILGHRGVTVAGGSLSSSGSIRIQNDSTLTAGLLRTTSLPTTPLRGDPRRSDSRGSDSRGSDSRGSDSRGSDSRGRDSIRDDSPARAWGEALGGVTLAAASINILPAVAAPGEGGTPDGAAGGSIEGLAPHPSPLP